MADDSFAFVAGIGPREVEPHSENELGVIVQGIGALMAWRTVPAFSATVVYELGDDARRYHFVARPIRPAYSLVDMKSGLVDSYDAVTREYVTESEPHDLDYHWLTPEASPARLAFPMSLLIWGRRIDAWRIGSGTRNGNELALGLVSTQDPQFRGSLTVDLEFGMAVRFDTPFEKIWYEGVEPHAE